jgi:aminopeptidase YwaD
MRAAEYIRDQLSSFGYDTTLQPFNFDSFIDLGTTVDIASPDPRPIEALALGASASGLAEGSLVSAGLGRPQEIPLGARGSVLLVQRGDITFSAKVANAEAAGALGVIVYNNKAGVVNGQLTATSAIPAAGISQTDGEALLALLNSGPVTVRLEAKTQETKATSHNVKAEPPGGGCSVVAGGHYDSVPEGPGANDNASGTAVVIEIARSRAAAGELNGVCYVLFGAEEIGLIGAGIRPVLTRAASQGQGHLNLTCRVGVVALVGTESPLPAGGALGIGTPRRPLPKTWAATTSISGDVPIIFAVHEHYHPARHVRFRPAGTPL